MTKDEVVAEQLRKLDYSHTNVKQALEDAYDAGHRRTMGPDEAPQVEAQNDTPAKKTKRRSE